MRHIRTRDLKARAEELLEGYDDAKNEAFNDEFRDFYKEYEINIDNNIITQDDIQGFIDNFTFLDEGDWSFDKVQEEIEDAADMELQLCKDEGICR